MDRLRFAVVPAHRGQIEVQVLVNEVEVTALGAGMGLDPYDIIVPAGRLSGGPEPTRATVAQCGCGFAGCGATHVVITREDDLVHWDWEEDVPMDRRVTFSARQHDEGFVSRPTTHGRTTAGVRGGSS